jgi:hypothetical protein
LLKHFKDFIAESSFQRHEPQITFPPPFQS